MDMKKIEELAADESVKRERYGAIGMRNIHGLTSAERVALDIEYAKARAVWVEAKGRLDAEING